MERPCLDQTFLEAKDGEREEVPSPTRLSLVAQAVQGFMVAAQEAAGVVAVILQQAALAVPPTSIRR